MKVVLAALAGAAIGYAIAVWRDSQDQNTVIEVRAEQDRPGGKWQPI